MIVGSDTVYTIQKGYTLELIGARTSVYWWHIADVSECFPEIWKHFFEEVEPNVSGELLYTPVKAAVSEKGRVFLEFHKDFYSRIKNMKEEAKTELEKTGVVNKVDWHNVEKILKERSGIAEDVTL